MDTSDGTNRCAVGQFERAKQQKGRDELRPSGRPEPVAVGLLRVGFRVPSAGWHHRATVYNPAKTVSDRVSAIHLSASYLNMVEKLERYRRFLQKQNAFNGYSDTYQHGTSALVFLRGLTPISRSNVRRQPAVFEAWSWTPPFVRRLREMIRETDHPCPEYGYELGRSTDPVSVCSEYHHEGGGQS